MLFSTNYIETLFILANAAFLGGTLMLARRVFKNRGAIKDYDPTGSLINFIGMTLSGIAFYLSGMGATVLIIILPTLIFWGMAAIFSYKHQLKSKNIDLNTFRTN